MSASKTDLRAAWLEAFEKLGGARGLAEWGAENPAAFYRMISRMLPREERVESDVRLIVTWDDGTEAVRPADDET